MSTENKYGNFTWYSYESTNSKPALEFYKSLLGWQILEEDMGAPEKLQMIKADTLTFADVEPAPGMGRNRWSTHVTVENVEATCERVKRMGGKVTKAPYTIPQVGRLAFVTDTFGSEIGIITPEKTESLNHSGMGEKEGQICWNELLVADPKAAVGFYSEVFGWKFEATDMGPMGSYYHLKANGKGCGGIMKTPPGAENMANLWMPYLTVNDIVAKTKQAGTLGAKVIKPPTHIPDTGYFSVIQDPAKCVSYLFQYTGKETLKV